MGSRSKHTTRITQNYLQGDFRRLATSVLSTETLEDYFDISTEAWPSGPYAFTITDGDKILRTEGVLIVQH